MNEEQKEDHVDEEKQAEKDGEAKHDDAAETLTKPSPSSTDQLRTRPVRYSASMLVFAKPALVDGFWYVRETPEKSKDGEDNAAEHEEPQEQVTLSCLVLSSCMTFWFYLILFSCSFVVAVIIWIIVRNQYQKATIDFTNSTLGRVVDAGKNIAEGNGV